MVKARTNLRTVRWVEMDGFIDEKPPGCEKYSFSCTLFPFEKNYKLKLVLKSTTPGKHCVTHVKNGRLKFKLEYNGDESATVGYGDMVQRTVITTRPNEEMLLAMYDLHADDVRECFEETCGLRVPVYFNHKYDKVSSHY